MRGGSPWSVPGVVQVRVMRVVQVRAMKEGGVCGGREREGGGGGDGDFGGGLRFGCGLGKGG